MKKRTSKLKLPGKFDPQTRWVIGYFLVTLLVLWVWLGLIRPDHRVNVTGHDDPGRQVQEDKRCVSRPVAAGILPAVETGFQPRGKNASNSATRTELAHIPTCRARIPGGRMPPSTAGKDACHYNRLWT